MKTCGFTIVRNAIQYDYPIVECLRSLLGICDQVVVAVGQSEDDTLSLVRSIKDPKLHIIETEWDLSLRTGGRLLAVETNKAFDTIPNEYDWVFYLQADEVLHEKDYPIIRQAMQQYLDQPKIEGLLFKYYHFYGSYEWIAQSRRWYRHEIRIIRNDKRIRSWRDAQGFRKDGRKLWVKAIDAHIYHYGWVRSPELMMNKVINFRKLYSTEEQDLEQNSAHKRTYQYSVDDILIPFHQSHPGVMQERLKKIDWNYLYDRNKARIGFKLRFFDLLARYLKLYPFEYRNYRLLH